MNKIKYWLSQKLIGPIKIQILQGTSIEKISMSIAVGISIACIPILGVSTVLGILLATIFSLNHIVLQSINYFAYPLQILFIIPFLTLGQRIFASEIIPLNLTIMLGEFGESPWLFLQKYIWIALYGSLLWLACAFIAIPVIYLAIKPVIRGLARSLKRP
jgi:uncharacterized protein (DUF2062 family)